MLADTRARHRRKGEEVSAVQREYLLRANENREGVPAKRIG